VTWSHEREHAGWREVARQKGSKVLENTRVIERAFLPAEVNLGDRDPFSEMEVTTDFRQRAWIRTPGLPVDARNGSGRIVIEQRKLGYRINAAMESPGWIVLSEQRWRGWRAYIDGRRVRMFPANIAFLGLYVPQGNHVVDIRYWPETFVNGRWISGATFVLLVAALCVVRFRKRLAYQ
jgi:membrane protein YfhO